MKILIHPSPARLENNQQSAKFFPISWWDKVITAFPKTTFYQIGTRGDEIVNNCITKFGLSEPEIIKLAKECDFVVATESFLPHLLHPYNIPCIVLFSRSDPEIFGYKENINLIKDRKYIREDIYGKWITCPVIPEAYIEPEILIKLLKKKKTKV